MAISVRLESNQQLRFEEFPTALVNYLEEEPQEGESSITLRVVDPVIQKTASVFFKVIDLQNIGISITALKKVLDNPTKLSAFLKSTSIVDTLLEKAMPIVSKQLSPRYLSFFKNRTFANRVITHSLFDGASHLKGEKERPGIYYHFQYGSKIFINLKKTSLGRGTYCKVKKALWLNGPTLSPQIVAKKVYKDPSDYLTWQVETAALSKFANKMGIVSLISSFNYDNKHIIILDSYEFNLWEADDEIRIFFHSIDEKLSAISQWLSGLATFSEHGIHGDIKPANLLLRRDQEGIKAVIADFGSYRRLNNLQYGVTTITAAPPEYYKERVVTLKHDVWGMGLSLIQLFAEKRPFFWHLDTEEKVTAWLYKLQPDWSLEYLKPETPPFVAKLITEMVDLRADHRPTPKEALLRFSTGNNLS